jgi:hypothetical protein
MKKVNLHEEISRIKNMMGLNESDYDSRGNYMGGNPPEWENEEEPMEVDVEPDQFLKNNFGEDINVRIIDADFDSGTTKMGDKYKKATFQLVYNNGEELPEEMLSSLESEFTKVDYHDQMDEEGNLQVTYMVTKKETYPGPEPMINEITIGHKNGYALIDNKPYKLKKGFITIDVENLALNKDGSASLSWDAGLAGKGVETIPKESVTKIYNDITTKGSSVMSTKDKGDISIVPAK